MEQEIVTTSDENVLAPTPEQLFLQTGVKAEDLSYWDWGKVFRRLGKEPPRSMLCIIWNFVGVNPEKPISVMWIAHKVRPITRVDFIACLIPLKVAGHITITKDGENDSLVRLTRSGIKLARQLTFIHEKKCSDMFLTGLYWGTRSRPQDVREIGEKFDWEPKVTSFYVGSLKYRGFTECSTTSDGATMVNLTPSGIEYVEKLLNPSSFTNLMERISGNASVAGAITAILTGVLGFLAAWYLKSH